VRLNRIPIAVLIAAVPAGALAQSAAAPDPAAVDLFVRKCGSCHTVGKGDRVGPDLKGAVERRGRPWVERFVGEPSAMLDSDPQARELLARFKGVRMPDLGLAPQQPALLAELIAACSAGPCDLAGKFTPVTQTTPAHVARGRDLFTGRAPLQNGAAPCLSCHSAEGTGVPVAGGTFSRDLTNAFARLGDQGLDAALSAPAFRVMGRAFGARPLAADEALALRAFLYESNRGAAGPPTETLSLPVLAGIAALVALFVLNTIWARRLRGVRSALVPHPRQEKAS
jgi:hypothetical protein